MEGRLRGALFPFFWGDILGATCPCELAVPAAPQAGLNNGITGWQTPEPGQKRAGCACPPHPPAKLLFGARGRPFQGRPLAQEFSGYRVFFVGAGPRPGPLPTSLCVKLDHPVCSQLFRISKFSKTHCVDQSNSGSQRRFLQGDNFNQSEAHCHLMFMRNAA